MLFGAEDGGHECLADVDAVLSLTEVVGVGGAVDVGGNLVDARQGMEDAHVGFASLEHGGGEDAAVFNAFVFEGIGEALALHTGHVDDVGCGDDALDVGVLVVFESCVLDAHLDGRGEFELVGGDEVEGGVEVAHGLDEGMDGTAIFEVADGGFPITNRGICYSTSPDPTISGLHTNDGVGLGSFVSQMTGLSTHTTYYVRAYATNSAGTVYGEQRTFITN